MTSIEAPSQFTPADDDAESTRPSDREVVLDFPELVRRCMGRIELADRLLASFTKRFPEEVAQIEDCLRSGDSQRLIRLAHQFKGTTANVSAPALFAAAMRMEDAARAERYETVVACIVEARRIFERLQACRVATVVGSKSSAFDRA